MRCCKPDCPRPTEFVSYPEGHDFAGYAMYDVYHPECCPGEADGTECHREHPEGWKSWRELEEG